jgi:hypothetical protein
MMVEADWGLAKKEKILAEQGMKTFSE